MTHDQAMHFWAEKIVARLRAENARSLSDYSLRKYLLPCVAGKTCYKIARELRENGYISLNDLKSQ